MGTHHAARRLAAAAARRATLTRDFFEREYVRAGKTLRELEAETGFPRKFLAATARGHGITVNGPLDPAPIDGDWLREQYLTRHRSYTGIAAELGVRPETVVAAARRHHIPSRPFTVHSRPEMITRLSTGIPGTSAAPSTAASKAGTGCAAARSP